MRHQGLGFVMAAAASQMFLNVQKILENAQVAAGTKDTDKADGVGAPARGMGREQSASRPKRQVAIKGDIEGKKDQCQQVKPEIEAGEAQAF
jgi:hypothetical protein